MQGVPKSILKQLDGGIQRSFKSFRRLRVGIFMQNIIESDNKYEESAEIWNVGNFFEV